jgi:hypothetical protein
MRRFSLFLILLIGLLAIKSGSAVARQGMTTPAAAQTQTQASPTAGSEVMIQSPKPGQTLQGSVPVVVNTTTEGFKSAELNFSYANDTSGTWFLIYQGIQPVTGTMLVLWDTSTITDGDYTLRMVVNFTDGSQQTALVSDVRVRNYTPIETNTPLPLQPTASRAPAVTPQPTIPPTGKPIQPTTVPTSTKPANPAEIGQQDVLQNIATGILVVVGLFILGLLYNAVRMAGRRR